MNKYVVFVLGKNKFIFFIFIKTILKNCNISERSKVQICHT